MSENRNWDETQARLLKDIEAFSRSKQDLKADFERVYRLFPVLDQRKSQPGGLSPAANSRCWPWAGPSWQGPSCSC